MLWSQCLDIKRTAFKWLVTFISIFLSLEYFHCEFYYKKHLGIFAFDFQVFVATGPDIARRSWDEITPGRKVDVSVAWMLLDFGWKWLVSLKGRQKCIYQDLRNNFFKFFW